MQNNEYFVKEKTTKLLLKFTIPCILSLLVNALYNIVDQIFIGNSSVGTIGNTATTIVFPLTCIALAFALLLGDGASALMSIRLGEKKKETLPKIVGNTLLISVIISTIFMAISLPLLPQILTLFGARTSESLARSIEYGTVIIYGIPFFIVGSAMNSVVRADGKPQIAMISMVAGAIINIILDALFIMVFDMQLFGAALATIIGQIASCIFTLIFIFKANNFKLSIKDFIPNGKEILEIMRLGISSFLTQISIVIISIVSMNMLAKYGAESKYGANDPQAILGVTMKVFTIFVNIAVGIAAGAQPVVGYNYGAKEYGRVKEFYRKIFISTFVVGLVATILFQTIPGAIIGIFGTNSSNPELYKEFGVLAVRIYLSLIIFTLLQKVTSIFLQSIGKSYKATLLSLTRDVIVFVPATICLPMAFGIEGVLYAAPFADVISIILTVIFIVVELKKLNVKKA